MPAFMPTFATMPDPRRDQTKLHKLIDILTIAVCAVIGGAVGGLANRLFGRKLTDAGFDRLAAQLAELVGFMKADVARAVAA